MNPDEILTMSVMDRLRTAARNDLQRLSSEDRRMLLENLFDVVQGERDWDTVPTPSHELVCSLAILMVYDLGREPRIDL